jgi:hypothetical protein
MYKQGFERIKKGKKCSLYLGVIMIFLINQIFNNDLISPLFFYSFIHLGMHEKALN